MNDFCNQCGSFEFVNILRTINQITGNNQDDRIGYGLKLSIVIVWVIWLSAPSYPSVQKSQRSLPIMIIKARSSKQLTMIVIIRSQMTFLIWLELGSDLYDWKMLWFEGVYNVKWLIILTIWDLKRFFQKKVELIVNFPGRLKSDARFVFCPDLIIEWIE